MRTQVCIIGGGPAGLMLAQLLHLAGVDCLVLERRSRAHVLSRIRAGVLEWGTVEMLRRTGLSRRMGAHGIVHDGIRIAHGGQHFRIDLKGLSGRSVMIWGQTEVTADLYNARDATGSPVIDEAEAVTPQGLDTGRPFVTYRKAGTETRIDCDFIAGCDGFHGVSRRSIPTSVLREYERIYPFGWLGLLSRTKPVADELIYAGHERGFALCSMRSTELSRYYLQVPLEDRAQDWTDAAFWDELRRRLPKPEAEALVTGPALEKSVAALRSHVAEPMRWGRLFLAGDAAHIVPPTGAKGLNLAFSDVHYLAEALTAHYRDGEAGGLDTYSDRALARVWQAERFSWSMTRLLHRFPEAGDFDQRLQQSEIGHLRQSKAAQTVLAENYVGLPY